MTTPNISAITRLQAARRAYRGRQGPRQETRESGAALILALVFLVAISLTVVALVSMAGTAMLTTANLTSQSSLEYAADGATDAAVQWVRYGSEAANDNCGEGTSFCLYLFNDTPGSTPGGCVSGPGETTTTTAGGGTPAADCDAPEPCLPNGAEAPAMTVVPSGPSIAVYCANAGTSSSVSAWRQVDFYACLAGGCTITVGGQTYSCSAASGCAAGGTGPSDILEAQVQFDDYCAGQTATTVVATTTTPSTCSAPGQLSRGSAMAILSWVVQIANH